MRDRWTLVILMLVTLGSQGIVVWNHSGFWDGSALLFAQEQHRYQALKDIFWNNGVPPSYYFHRVVGLFPSPILAYRLIYLASTALSGYYLCRILVRAVSVPYVVGLTAGIISVLMPFSIISFDTSLVFASILMLAFLIAVDFFLTALSSSRPIGWPRRLVMLGLFALSYFYGTFHFLAMMAVVASTGAMVWHAARLVRRGAASSEFMTVFARFRAWPEMYLLPFAFLVVRRLTFRPKGRYEGYNELAWLDAAQWRTWASMPQKYWQRLWEVLVPPNVPFSTVQLKVLVIGAAAMALWMLWHGRRRARNDFLAEAEQWPLRKYFGIAALMLVILYLAVWPHFLVGRRELLFSGYLSRDNIVANLPAAAALVLILFSLARVRVAIVLAVLIATRLTFFQTELARKWLDDDLTLKMIAAQARELPEMQLAEIVVVDDHAMHFNHLEWLEFQHVLARAFGTETRMAFAAWELDRCQSVKTCVERLTYPIGDPLTQLGGARDARRCGLVVKAQLERLTAVQPTWSDYAIGRAGGPALTALAKQRIRIGTTLLQTLPCAS